MVYLIDANIIIRFLIIDNHEQFLKSKSVFYKIESAQIEAEILSEVLMEVFFVLTKFYKIEREIVISKLKEILLLKGIVNQNKYILIETLNLMLKKNIDYVDALICVKEKFENYKTISFDKDVNKRCKE